MYQFPIFYLGAVRCRELYILHITTTYSSCKFRMFLKPAPPTPLSPPTDLSSNSAHFETTAVLPLCPTVPRPVPMTQSSWKPQTDKPYMCSKCGKGLSHIFTLNRHCKTVCGKVRSTSGKWKCEHCTRSYKTEGNLARHTRYECGVPRQFYCVFCNRAFTQRCSLSRHLRNFHNQTNQSSSGMVVDFDRSGSNESDSAYCSSESARSSI